MEAIGEDQFLFPSVFFEIAAYHNNFTVLNPICFIIFITVALETIDLIIGIRQDCLKQVLLAL